MPTLAPWPESDKLGLWETRFWTDFTSVSTSAPGRATPQLSQIPFKIYLEKRFWSAHLSCLWSSTAKCPQQLFLLSPRKIESPREKQRHGPHHHLPESNEVQENQVPWPVGLAVQGDPWIVSNGWLRNLYFCLLCFVSSWKPLACHHSQYHGDLKWCHCPKPWRLKFFTDFPVGSSHYYRGIFSQDSTSDSWITLKKWMQSYGHLCILGTPTRDMDCISPARDYLHLMPSLGRCGTTFL